MHGTAAWPVNDPGTHSNRAFVFLRVRPSLFLFLLLSFSPIYLSTDSLYHQQATLVSEIWIPTISSGYQAFQPVIQRRQWSRVSST
ncbi:hypothetical protein BJX62DRAFT_192110 [Aspergillus germanicus]